MNDRELFVTELNEARAQLLIVNSQLYNLTLQRIGLIECVHGLEELFNRCQAEDANKAKEANETEKKVSKKA